jgi:hypothetical protein
VATGSVVLRWIKAGTNEPTRTAANDRPVNRALGFSVSSNAPWGELEITRIMLERPEAMFGTNRAPAAAIRWFFKNHSSRQVSNLFASCSLTDGQRVSMLDTNRWEKTPNGWWILPSLEMVKEMDPAARETIYSVLARMPENAPQRFPFVYRADGFEEWVSGSELSGEQLSLARRLCYMKSGVLYFADMQLFELLTSFDEAQSLIQTLSRVPTLLMKLRVRPESDIEGLAKYWGRGGNSEHVIRLLRGLARQPEGSSINVSYFLPPIPRLRLYTYPKGTNAGREDGFWTAYNFFNERPDYTLRAPKHPNELLQPGYWEVRGEKGFGDLLLLWEGGDTVAHACAYVADDVVYTKNGDDFHQPWVLMRMRDLMTLYASERKQEWRVFRRSGS